MYTDSNSFNNQKIETDTKVNFVRHILVPKSTVSCNPLHSDKQALANSAQWQKVASDQGLQGLQFIQQV